MENKKYDYIYEAYKIYIYEQQKAKWTPLILQALKEWKNKQNGKEA